MNPFVSNRSKLLLDNLHTPAVKSFSFNAPNSNSSSQGSNGISFYKDINGASVASASLTKYASSKDFSEVLKNKLITEFFHTCEIISDQVGKKRSSIIMKDCVLDNFTFNILHNEISETSYEMSSDSFEKKDSTSANIVQKTTDSYLTNSYFKLTCSNEVLQSCDSFSASLTWSKAFASGLSYKTKKIWSNNMEAEISLTVNNVNKQIISDLKSISKTSIKVEVFSDEAKTAKICEFDFADCFLSGYSEGYTDSAVSLMNLSFKYVDSVNKNAIIFT